MERLLLDLYTGIYRRYLKMFKIIESSFVQSIFQTDLQIDKKLYKKIKEHKIKKYSQVSTSYFDNDLPNYLKEEIKKYLKDYVSQVAKLLNKKSYSIERIWIQKYGVSDWHNMHIHDSKEASYSFILYIDGGKKSGATRFYNLGYPYIHYTQHLESKPVPGKCLIFFGALPHEALPSRDNKKVIVSGNISFS